jgi:hypothetical protein
MAEGEGPNPIGEIGESEEIQSTESSETSEIEKGIPADDYRFYDPDRSLFRRMPGGMPRNPEIRR